MLKPSLEVFESLTKDDLFSLGKHLELEVKKSMRKDQIQNIIIKHLVALKVFDSAALAESFATSDTELRKLELELELKKLEMQRERELKEQEFREREMERDRQEKEKERELRLEKKRLDHELELKKLELGGKFKSSNHFGASSTVDFEVTKHIRLVPPFQESDVDKYFLHFEKVAENLKWPKQYWTMLLQSVLIGKAREIYTQLSVVQSSDYDAVKQLILKGYELVPEASVKNSVTVRKRVIRPMLNLLEKRNNCLIVGVFLRALTRIIIS